MSAVKPPSLIERVEGQWALYVPWEDPPTKNNWERMHWGARSEIKADIFAMLVVAKADCRGLRPLRWPVMIQPVVYRGPVRGRMADPSGYQVTINECLIDQICEPRISQTKKGGLRSKKGIGLIPDDGPKYVTEYMPIVEHGSSVLGVELIITEQGV